MNRLCIHKAFVFEPKTRTMIILNYIKLQEKNKSLHFTQLTFVLLYLALAILVINKSVVS